jgi:LuxR family maltose regulon positive regulatory protein
MENQTGQADCWYNKGLEAYQSKNYHMFAIEDMDKVQKLLVLCKSGIAVRRMDVKEIAACYQEASQFNVPASDHGEFNAHQPSLLKTSNLFYGRVKLLLDTFTPIMECLAKCHDKTKAYFKVAQAEVFYEGNRPDECLRMLMESLEEVLDLNYTGAMVPFFFTLAKVRRARGDKTGAFEAVAECRKRVGSADALWGYVIDIFTAGMYLEMNDIQAAEGLLRFSRMDMYDKISSINEFEMYTYAKYLLQTNSSEKAVILLNRLSSFAEKEKRHYSRIEILCLLSAAYWLNNNKDDSVAALEKAIELGMADGYIRVFLDEPRIEKTLSRYINEHKGGTNKKRNYAQRLYRLMVNRPRPVIVPVISRKNPVGKLLTKKEIQVLRLVAKGCSNLEIAEELGISENTVKYHNKNIYSKTNIRNRQSAVILAKEIGL